MNPLAPAENHPNCRRNAAGEPVLPSGNPWKQQMLLLCLSSKILSDADSLLKISATNTGACVHPLIIPRFYWKSNSQTLERLSMNRCS